MTDIVLHDKTKQVLEGQINNPAQAILLTGEPGIGKYYTALWLAASLLNVSVMKATNSPAIMQIEPNGKTIPVSSIREINSFIKLKSVNEGKVKRIILIDKAGQMTIEAQNALLKNLEEPPAGTLFILTATSSRELLPTIVSRLQVVKILPPSREQLLEFFQNPRDNNYNLSGGLPGLFWALHLDDTNHPLVEAINLAKGYLAAPSFDRLKIGNELSNQKGEALSLAQALKRLANAAMLNAASQGDDSKVKRWQNILEAALSAQESLLKEGNLKLVLTNLALSL